MVKFITLWEVIWKELYITDPSKHKFLVTSDNSPSTLSNIFSSVLVLFPRFGNRQGDTNKHKNKDQKQSAIKATNSSKGTNFSTSIDTIQEVNVSDLSADISINQDACETPALHGSLFQNSTCNEMLTHYNRIVIGCFKDFFPVSQHKQSSRSSTGLEGT